jgi:hypothetical protein
MSRGIDAFPSSTLDKKQADSLQQTDLDFVTENHLGFRETSIRHAHAPAHAPFLYSVADLQEFLPSRGACFRKDLLDPRNATDNHSCWDFKGFLCSGRHRHIRV